MIADRLIYGCARLTGGVSTPVSRRLVEACLAAGVRHFDSAPSYGMGTAEAVLGSALDGRPDVRVTAKVGSTRPRFAGLRTYARALKGMVRERGSPLRDSFAPLTVTPRAGDGWTREAMERSIDRSRRALRRERFDLLLLHEICPADIDEGLLAFLADMRARGVAAAVGYSTGAALDSAAVARAPVELVGQSGVTLAMLNGERIGGEPAFLHSIANTVLFGQRTDATFGRWLVTASALIPESVVDRRTATITAGFARLRALWPDRGLIFASIDPGRLAAFLAAVAHVDRHVGPEPFGTASNLGSPGSTYT